MAACLITTGGTNGTLRIDYDLGANHNIEYTNFGDVIWIDNTATNVTYTTLTGDVTATSGCVTITALPRICYLIQYDRWSGDPDTITYISTFDALLKDNTVSTFTTPADDTLIALPYLISEINDGLNDDTVKIVAAKSEIIDINYMTISLIVRVYGNEIPYLRIKSPYDNYSYLKGAVSASCLPTGFTEVPVSEPDL